MIKTAEKDVSKRESESGIGCLIIGLFVGVFLPLAVSLWRWALS